MLGFLSIINFFLVDLVTMEALVFQPLKLLAWEIWKMCWRICLVLRTLRESIFASAWSNFVSYFLSFFRAHLSALF